MFPHLGGKQIILKFDVKTQTRINTISINWMARGLLQLVAFARAIEKGLKISGVSDDDSRAISRMMILFSESDNLSVLDQFYRSAATEKR